MRPNRKILGLLFLVTILSLAGVTFSQKQNQKALHREDSPRADLVLLNGKIITLDEHNTQAHAIAVKGNRILFVGNNVQVMDYVEKGKTEMIDLRGKPVIPGFNDAHLHFLSGGLSLMRVNLAGCKTKAEITAKLKQKIKETPEGSWIVGRGWDHTLFNKSQWPDKKFLNQLTSLHPVYLTRIDGHVAWVNSLALLEAKIDKDIPDPEGGEIVRDSMGNPTGILKENAADLVANLIPPPTEADMQKAIQTAIAEAKENGITSIQDNSDLNVLPIYNTLAEQGNLTVRISEWLPFEWIKTPEKIDSLKSAFTERPNLLKLGPFKGYVDGTLGSRTAYLFEPYSDDTSTMGIPQYKQEELGSLITKADKMGFQICFHAIGDKGNYLVLKAFEKALLTNKRKNSRHRIEHAQVLREEDIPLFGKLGVVASMQPTHCTSDKRWAEDRLGKKRCQGAYAWKSLLVNGAHLAFGTDWPVEPLNPLIGLYAAVTRKDPQNPEPGAGWYRRECISLMEALKGYTIGAAYAEFQDSLKGSLEEGKLADMVVLSKDIFTLPPEEILKTQVEATIFDGQVIYVRLKE
ncbi:MAG: hypothetical protein RBG1_1C00001G0745 [candidate division Zixibacteria bacterium RBG-1]|nr:MAG: hypothetical protein RBG1_1C00001G0745 [candidate division Zixibacteria bacterium RBG-1]